MKDRQSYDLQFTQYIEPDAPLITFNTDNSHWSRNVNLHKLSQLQQKVLLAGSLFGASRIVGELDLFNQFSDLMAFETPRLIEPASAIVQRLGGREGFFGIHARIGDGIFIKRGRENIKTIWDTTVRQLGASEEILEEMWETVKFEEDVQIVPPSSIPAASTSSHNKRSRSPRSFTNLKCRQPLHTSPSLQLFNTPIYLATDSRHPLIDPVLAPIFKAFPCTFTLTDFTEANEINDGIIVEGVGEMLRLVNEDDGMALGRLFLPFLEAIIAAKGFGTVSWRSSSFHSWKLNPDFDSSSGWNAW